MNTQQKFFELVFVVSITVAVWFGIYLYLLWRKPKPINRLPTLPDVQEPQRVRFPIASGLRPPPEALSEVRRQHWISSYQTTPMIDDKFPPRDVAAKYERIRCAELCDEAIKDMVAAKTSEGVIAVERLKWKILNGDQPNEKDA